MKIVVDTNIIFSTLLHTQGNIGDLFFNSGKYFEIYSCFEILKHWKRLKKISGLTEDKLQVSYGQVLSKLKFINEEIIPSETWASSEKITNGIDPDDIDFVALTKFLNATLWTGDKVLYQGLKKANFKKVMTTTELLALRTRKRERKS